MQDPIFFFHLIFADLTNLQFNYLLHLCVCVFVACIYIFFYFFLYWVHICYYVDFGIFSPYWFLFVIYVHLNQLNTFSTSECRSQWYYLNIVLLILLLLLFLFLFWLIVRIMQILLVEFCFLFFCLRNCFYTSEYILNDSFNILQCVHKLHKCAKFLLVVFFSNNLWTIYYVHYTFTVFKEQRKMNPKSWMLLNERCVSIYYDINNTKKSSFSVYRQALKSFEWMCFSNKKCRQQK